MKFQSSHWGLVTCSVQAQSTDNSHVETSVFLHGHPFLCDLMLCVRNKGRVGFNLSQFQNSHWFQ